MKPQSKAPKKRSIGRGPKQGSRGRPKAVSRGAASRGKVASRVGSRGEVADAVKRVSSIISLSKGDKAYLQTLLPQVTGQVRADPAATAAAAKAPPPTTNNVLPQKKRGWWSRAKSFGRRAVGKIITGVGWLLQRPEVMFVAALALLYVKNRLCDILRERRFGPQRVQKVVRPPTMGENSFAYVIDALSVIPLLGRGLGVLIENLGTFVLPFTNWVENLIGGIASSPWVKIILGILAFFILKAVARSLLDLFGLPNETFDTLLRKVAQYGGSFYILWKIFSEECIPKEQKVLMEWVEPGTPDAIHRLEFEHQQRPDAPLRDVFEKNLKDIAAYNGLSHTQKEQERLRLQGFFERMPSKARRRASLRASKLQVFRKGEPIPVPLTEEEKKQFVDAYKNQKPVEQELIRTTLFKRPSRLTAPPSAPFPVTDDWYRLGEGNLKCACLGPAYFPDSFRLPYDKPKRACTVAPNCPYTNVEPSSTSPTGFSRYWFKF